MKLRSGGISLSHLFPALHRRINLEFKAKQIRNKLNPTSKQPPRVIMGIPAGAPARDV
ncbi:hypothetical protein MA16_Dca009208 [Dendrobium catenatum]|uniref:Uncharacterized protein n=1 Tax=Dendrobium catenatum TaxID=906689 RepID=A0A2I0VR39_9ASPA|nr:hypothetical protein MA16_Dca009208 [Dendrobium catenatum]